MFDLKRNSIIILILYCYIQRIRGSEDSKMNFTDVVESFNYPTEIHEIETDDGYLLDVYRVPYGLNSVSEQPNSHPIILNHGLMGSAESFIIGGPSKALVYVLADNGYDVWLCNARGTWHSRKHKTLNPDKDSKFWKFTWHEIGFYDIPATIDYILQKTNKTKLHYAGHSQGTTTFFAMMSERPEYSEKINVMVAMAPSALLSHIKEPSLRLIAPAYKYLQTLAETLKVYELIPNYLLSNTAMRIIGKSFCEEQSPTRFLCSNILVAMSGYSPEQLDPESITLIASTSPAGASVYQALHYAQLIVTGKFIKYDWGAAQNQKRYNSTQPPEYNLGHVTCKVALMYGESDIMVTKEDVEILAGYLPNVVDAYKVPYEKWSHMDFIWARDLDKYINKHMLRVLRKFNQ